MIVAACGYATILEICESFKNQTEQVYLIGDTVSARGIEEALAEAVMAAYRFKTCIDDK